MCPGYIHRPSDVQIQFRRTATGGAAEISAETEGEWGAVGFGLHGCGTDSCKADNCFQRASVGGAIPAQRNKSSKSEGRMGKASRRSSGHHLSQCASGTQRSIESMSVPRKYSTYASTTARFGVDDSLTAIEAAWCDHNSRTKCPNQMRPDSSNHTSPDSSSNQDPACALLRGPANPGYAEHLSRPSPPNSLASCQASRRLPSTLISVPQRSAS